MKTYRFKIDGKDFEVAVNSVDGQNADVTVNGIQYDITLASAAAECPTAVPGERATGVNFGTAARQASSVAAMSVKSPLPGIIVGIEVAEGQAVKRGQRVAVIEAMKMENDILAEKDGVVSRICVAKGDSVLEGAEIMILG